MLKQLAKCIREYKKPTFVSLFFITMEVVIEVFIPFITANLVNSIKAGAEMSEVVKIGVFLALLACLSLSCGAIAGYACSKASAGFAKNLRHDMFEKIQGYSFENIDKFSSSSLVTRMTTDISHVQMSYMMIIRTAIRSPLMLIFSVIMAYIMGGALASTFVVVIPVLTFGLIMIGRKAMPAFKRVFRKYDRLNESIEENVRAMRVVKGFSREDYEKEKFAKSSDEIRKDFTKAERIVACNTPVMQFCVYFNMIFVLIVGSYM
ncbi:MAG: ABC transporter ATP-binding protein, partial [Oscillospiraceae bacterium]|nr:ABC transporter ATP-binding protein [Oscillospiraceae bacterium]